MRASPGDNLRVENKTSSRGVAESSDPFLPGALVIVSLGNPREKFWGMILALGTEGFRMSGADLASFEDIAAMAREGEPFHPTIVFFPMHRIERVVLDLPDGSLSSLSQRFLAKTGLDPLTALAPSNIHGLGIQPFHVLPSHSKEHA